MSFITMPKLSDTMEEGKIIKWLKQVGDQVNQGEPIAEIETDKANVEMEAFDAGVIKEFVIQEGESIAVGEPIAELESSETPPEKAPAQASEHIPAEKTPEPYTTEQVPGVTKVPPEEKAPEKVEVAEKVSAEERILVSPIARKMAEEHGIDLSEITGTGPGGRIVEDDIEAYSGEKKEEKPEAKPEIALRAPTEIPSEEQPISKMRKTIGDRMRRSKQTIPHFYVTAEIEMDWAERVREELNSDESQTKVSVTDFVVKACALALAKIPEVNASLSDGNLQIHKEVNIGMAVAVENGLLVPVIHNADKKPIREMAQTTKELAKRARDNKLKQSDYTGATFTISNLGMFDVESFISIINPPESASLAIGSIKEMPVVEDGHISVSKRMKATLSADHRVMDGAVAAKFLQEMKRLLQMPINLIT